MALENNWGRYLKSTPGANLMQNWSVRKSANLKVLKTMIINMAILKKRSHIIGWVKDFRLKHIRQFACQYRPLMENYRDNLTRYLSSNMTECRCTKAQSHHFGRFHACAWNYLRNNGVFLYFVAPSNNPSCHVF